MSHLRSTIAIHVSLRNLLIIVVGFLVLPVPATIFFPRGGSFGYLAAVATPLDLPNRNVYVAFNFESNYGLPSNESYNEWIDRWNLDEQFLGIGNNVTGVNGRRSREKRSSSSSSAVVGGGGGGGGGHFGFTRSSFYRCVMGYLEYFRMNGTACLLRTICEVSATPLDEHNGLLGSIFKILFMPTTSAPEHQWADNGEPADDWYAAEMHGRTEGDCAKYTHWCPEGVISMISDWY